MHVSEGEKTDVERGGRAEEDGDVDDETFKAWTCLKTVVERGGNEDGDNETFQACKCFKTVVESRGNEDGDGEHVTSKAWK